MKKKSEIKELALTFAQVAYDKKGDDIKILDMEGISYLADYFIIISAGNKRMAQSIADELKGKGGISNIQLKHQEGYSEGGWILLDFGDIVCHIFSEEQRAFYGLETLWNDANYVPFVGE